MRYLLGMTISSKGEIDVADEEIALLGADNPDELFGGEQAAGEDAGAVTAFSDAELDNILGDAPRRQLAGEIDTGAWHFLLVKLQRAGRAAGFIDGLNRWFTENGIAAQAAGWEQAAGPFATTADVIRTVFDVAIIVIGIVAVIIVMNTLVISVIERTAEIGTMRALGARKGFIWRMFLWETLAITVVFGAFGILLALSIITVLNVAGIPATNVFLRILFAGPTLRPVASAASILLSVAVVVAVGLLAHLYPVSVALKIPPVRAIQAE
jgi:ABC-type antimicrobial peptide transport system permease subunit